MCDYVCVYVCVCEIHTLYLSHTITRTHCFSLSYKHTYTHSLSLSPHGSSAFTHTQSLSLSHSLSHTHALSFTQQVTPGSASFTLSLSLSFFLFLSHFPSFPLVLSLFSHFLSFSQTFALTHATGDTGLGGLRVVAGSRGRRHRRGVAA